MYKTLLPPSSTKLEKAIEHCFRYTDDLSVLIKESSNASICHTDFLPFLAWTFSISDEEGWIFAESEEARRTLINRSIEIHKKKGTVWAIREVFRMLGLGEVDILENVGRLFYDGTYEHDQTMVYGGDFSSTWATYIVKIYSPITNDQSAFIRKILEGIAPARSELRRLDYGAVAIRYNAVAKYDETYNHGSA